MNMECCTDVVYPFFVFPPPEKLVSIMQAVLDGTQCYSPGDWLAIVRQHDPDHRYIVTAVSQFKQRSLFPDFQHEYVLLSVRSRDPTTPTITIIRVSRTITNHTLPTQLGLWGPADDSVTVIGNSNHVQIHDKRILHLTWAPDEAPDLEQVSMVVDWVHRLLPRYHLFKTSCYSFTRAISDSVHITLNGIEDAQHPPFFMRRSHFLRFIPVGITSAQGATHAIAVFTGHD